MDQKPLNILFVARDNGGCGFYRCVQPSSFLKRSGFAESETVLKEPTPQRLLEADLVVMQEMGNVESLQIAKFLIEKKIPFITEMDDFIHHVSPHNEGGYPAWNPGTLYVHRAMELVRKSQGLTVTNEALGREYFPYNPHIYIVPNYLDKDRWDIPQAKRADGKIRIGWCGGNAHADDLKMIAPVIERIVREYDGKVIFETMGMTDSELRGVFPMSASSENPCPSCKYEGTLHHFNGEIYDNLPSVLSSRGWDIAVAPVIDNAFGNCKSDLKLKEYSAIGYPVVASDVFPYAAAKKDGADVLLATTYEDWYNHLKDLIEDPEMRRKMAQNNKIWMEQHWIQERLPDIFEIYKDVIVRYAQAHGLKPAS